MSDSNVLFKECRKSKIQEYGCTVCSKPFFSKNKFICYDKCLTDELFYLWDLGIETTGCCCGHGIETAYIGVVPNDIEKMMSLGYQVQFNSNRPDDRDTFNVKTKLKWDKESDTIGL